MLCALESEVSMARYVFPLQESAESARFGGKAANLQRLLAADFPVPLGVCVTVDAYRDHLRNNGLEDEMRRILAATDFQDVHQVEERAQEIRRLILAHPMPSEVAEEIRRWYRDLYAGPERAVVVRSSATTEDLPEASFAGQHDSYLNIAGEERVVSSVAECWASLWTTRAVHYRFTHGLQSLEAAMAVVIQEMVFPRAAGVSFTADPVNGDTTKLLINATWGLGEGIAAGQVDADTFVVDKATLAVLSTTIGEKATSVVAAEAGGIRSVPTDEARASLPSLTEGEVRRVSELGRSIEEEFGAAQDIEWCVRDGQVVVLQSRPMTGVDLRAAAEEQEFPLAWDDPEDQKYTWYLGAEGVEEPTTPLEADLQQVWTRGRQNAVTLIGSRMGRLNQLRVFNGRQYYRQSNMGLTEEEIAELNQRHLAKARAYREQGTDLWHAEVWPEVLADHERLYPFPFHEMDLKKLLAYLEEVFTVYERHWTLHWMRNGDERSRPWTDTFRELTGNDNEGDALELLHGEPNKSIELMDRLRALAKRVQGTPTLKESFQQTTSEQLMDVLKASPEAAEFLEQLEEFLEEFGYRTGNSFGSRTSLLTPTWREDPGIVFTLIRIYLTQDLDRLEEQQKDRERERQEAKEAIRERLRGEPEKLADFDEQLAIWRTQPANMEDHNHYIDQKSSAPVRLTMVQIGKALRELGVLQERDDVFYLTLDEVRQAADPTAASHFVARVKERRADYGWWRTLSAPPWVGAAPAVEAEGRWPAKPAGEEGSDGEDLDTGDVIRGSGTCPGQHTGRARVIIDPEVIPEVESGDILVAVNAGALWTPVFPVLGGLVLDMGVATQHAALVAREYGVPTVIQTRVATKRIQDGQIVTIDGSQGTVHLNV